MTRIEMKHFYIIEVSITIIIYKKKIFKVLYLKRREKKGWINA